MVGLSAMHERGIVPVPHFPLGPSSMRCGLSRVVSLFVQATHQLVERAKRRPSHQSG